MRPPTIASRPAAFHSTKLDCQNEKEEEEVLDPLVVCGPSGVGKGTIIQRFLESKDDDDSSSFVFGVSHTTRAPRTGEVHVKDYFFCSPEDMQGLVESDYFVEWAHVHGNTYGTSWSAIREFQATGKRCLLDIDVQGVQRLKSLSSQKIFQLKYLFIAPPSLDVLETRLRGRGSESEETLARRVGNAAAEVEYGLTEGNFDKVIVNDNLDQAVEDFQRAVDSLYARDSPSDVTAE